MFRRSAAAVLLCAAACLSFSPDAIATLVAPLDLDELVSRADVVAIGRVAHATPQRRAGGSVETAVALSGVTVLKGAPGGTVTFTVPGGRIGRYRTVVPGAPVLSNGEEIVVFLRETQPGRLGLVGFSQGLVPVTRDRVTSEASVMAPLSRAAAEGRVVRGDPARRPVPLSAFARQIQSLVSRVPASPDVTRGQVPDRGKGNGASS